MMSKHDKTPKIVNKGKKCDFGTHARKSSILYHLKFELCTQVHVPFCLSTISVLFYSLAGSLCHPSSLG